VFQEQVDPRWVSLKKKLNGSNNIIDLGCGNNPIAGAKVGVDFYLDPQQRGSNDSMIDSEKFKERGIKFFHTRIDAPLPFKDKEFDFAYSHHVFEHLEDPATACSEMMRIAKAGAIITPSFFAEQIFGRPYHHWLVMDRDNCLFFFRKRPHEQTPFGSPPKYDKGKNSFFMDEDTNPFDMLLNDEGWYKGQAGQMPKLSRIIQKHWYTHSRLLEIVFIWENDFQCQVFNNT